MIENESDEAECAARTELFATAAEDAMRFRRERMAAFAALQAQWLDEERRAAWKSLADPDEVGACLGPAPW